MLTSTTASASPSITQYQTANFPEAGAAEHSVPDFSSLSDSQLEFAGARYRAAPSAVAFNDAPVSVEAGSRTDRALGLDVLHAFADRIGGDEGFRSDFTDPAIVRRMIEAIVSVVFLSPGESVDTDAARAVADNRAGALLGDASLTATDIWMGTAAVKIHKLACWNDPLGKSRLYTQILLTLTADADGDVHIRVHPACVRTSDNALQGLSGSAISNAVMDVLSGGGYGASVAEGSVGGAFGYERLFPPALIRIAGYPHASLGGLPAEGLSEIAGFLLPHDVLKLSLVHRASHEVVSRQAELAKEMSGRLAGHRSDIAVIESNPMQGGAHVLGAAEEMRSTMGAILSRQMPFPWRLQCLRILLDYVDRLSTHCTWACSGDFDVYMPEPQAAWEEARGKLIGLIRRMAEARTKEGRSYLVEIAAHCANRGNEGKKFASAFDFILAQINRIPLDRGRESLLLELSGTCHAPRSWLQISRHLLNLGMNAATARPLLESVRLKAEGSDLAALSLSGQVAAQLHYWAARLPEPEEGDAALTALGERLGVFWQLYIDAFRRTSGIAPLFDR